jgi:hypothetical protein
MLTSAELTAMQAVQAQAMLDACKLLPGSDVEGSYGQEDTTYADTGISEVACGFEAATAARGGSIAGVTVELSAQIRLSLTNGAGVTPNHHIKLTKRLGVTLSPAEEYQVVGWPKRGPTCYVVEVQRVS